MDIYNEAKTLEKNNLSCGGNSIRCPIMSAASQESPAPVKFLKIVFFMLYSKYTSSP